MVKDKYCKRCGKYIGNVDTYPKGYYSFIKTQYCDDCRNVINNLTAKERMRRYRRRKKQEHEEELKQITLLKQENEQLRKNIVTLREELDKRKVVVLKRHGGNRWFIQSQRLEQHGYVRLSQ